MNSMFGLRTLALGIILSLISCSVEVKAPEEYPSVSDREFVEVALKELNEMDSVSVTIIDHPFTLSSGVYGMVEQEGNNYYKITLFGTAGLSQKRKYLILAHEILHIIQYEEKRLIYEKGIIVVFEEKLYNLMTVEYRDRPWEKEAFAKQRKFRNEIVEKIKELR